MSKPTYQDLINKRMVLVEKLKPIIQKIKEIEKKIPIEKNAIERKILEIELYCESEKFNLLDKELTYIDEYLSNTLDKGRR